MKIVRLSVVLFVDKTLLNSIVSGKAWWDREALLPQHL